MLFTVRSGEFEPVIFNKFMLVWSRCFLLQYFTRRISPSAFVNLICLSASWHENSLSELGMANLIEIMFGSHPSSGTGGHFWSARVMKRLWKKQVSIDQLNIVMQIHFLHFCASVKLRRVSLQHRHISHKAVNSTELVWMWDYGTTVFWGPVLRCYRGFTSRGEFHKSCQGHFQVIFQF